MTCAVVGAVAVVVAAVPSYMSLVVAWRNHDAVGNVGVRVEALHVSVNGRLTELLLATRAQGAAEGTERERERGTES